MAVEPGTLDVLNVGKGHLRLTITDGDKAEMDKARQMIEDMLARGYAIFVETKRGPRRVKRFNPKRLEYIIDVPEAGGKPAEHKVAASKSKATAVGRSAGG